MMNPNNPNAILFTARDILGSEGKSRRRSSCVPDVLALSCDDLVRAYRPVCYNNIHFKLFTWLLHNGEYPTEDARRCLYRPVGVLPIDDYIKFGQS